MMREQKIVPVKKNVLPNHYWFNSETTVQKTQCLVLAVGNGQWYRVGEFPSRDLCAMVAERFVIVRC